MLIISWLVNFSKCFKMLHIFTCLKKLNLFTESVKCRLRFLYMVPNTCCIFSAQIALQLSQVYSYTIFFIWIYECIFKAPGCTNFENLPCQCKPRRHLCGFDVYTSLAKKTLDALLQVKSPTYFCIVLDSRTLKMICLATYFTYNPEIFTTIIPGFFTISTEPFFIITFNFFAIQSNLYKMTTLGTTQKWSSWASGCLIKHLYTITTKQMWSSLAGYEFFPSVIFAWIKICNCACFGAILED